MLTVENFDLAKVKEALDGSSLGAIQKTTLVTALEGAEGNPDLLGEVLTQVREALNL